MQASTIQARIRQNPKFAELVTKRTRLAILLSVVVLVPYYTFMMITAFNPAMLAQPVSFNPLAFRQFAGRGLRSEFQQQGMQSQLPVGEAVRHRVQRDQPTHPG